jgi:hypothetical protein
MFRQVWQACFYFKRKAAANIGIYKIWGDGCAISIFASPGSSYRATDPIGVLVGRENCISKQVQ